MNMILTFQLPHITPMSPNNHAKHAAICVFSMQPKPEQRTNNRVATGQGKVREIQGQGKVRES